MDILCRCREQKGCKSEPGMCIAPWQLQCNGDIGVLNVNSELFLFHISKLMVS